MIRQYRYPLDEWCWEVPAGGCHDTGDMALEDVVRKELHEEIGATCGEVRALSSFYSAPSFCDEKCHVFLALDVELRDEPEPEDTERIEVHRVPVAQALQMARAAKSRLAPAPWLCCCASLFCHVPNQSSTRS
jgi:ADP-ribose pyrophosphatase